MSKRWGNVVNPDDVVKEYGADTLRLYEMFMGPFDQSVAWSTSSMAGVNRFLERFWKLRDKITEEVELSSDVQMEVHKTIKKVGDDIEQFKFNTAISQMMILLNILEKEKGVSRVIYKTFTQLLAPFAPHLTEEIWLCLGNEESIHRSSWPTYDETKLYSDTVTVAVQIGGKMRGTIEIQRDFDDSLVIQEVKVTEIYKKYVGEVEPKKIIIVKNKIVNIVI
jgi:leucyl-tRNA synthetase